jgi:hypothetical protein
MVTLQSICRNWSALLEDDTNDTNSHDRNDRRRDTATSNGIGRNGAGGAITPRRTGSAFPQASEIAAGLGGQPPAGGSGGSVP